MSKSQATGKRKLSELYEDFPQSYLDDLVAPYDMPTNWEPIPGGVVEELLLSMEVEETVSVSPELPIENEGNVGGSLGSDLDLEPAQESITIPTKKRTASEAELPEYTGENKLARIAEPVATLPHRTEKELHAVEVAATILGLSKLVEEFLVAKYSTDKINFVLSFKKISSFIKALSSLDNKIHFLYDLGLAREEIDSKLQYFITDSDGSHFILKDDQATSSQKEVDTQTPPKTLIEGESPTDREQKIKDFISASQSVGVHEIQHLLYCSSCINAADDQGKTPLIHLVKNSLKATVERVTELVKLGADVNAKDPQGKTPLMYAAERSAVKLIKTLVELRAEINAVDHQGKTALMYAVKEGQKEVTISLINLGAEINAVDLQGKTALSYAAGAKKNAGPLVKLLSNRINAVGTPDHHNTTTPDLTSLLKRFERSDKLTAVFNKLIEAAQRGNLAIIEEIKADSDPQDFISFMNNKDANGLTVLMNAALNGRNNVFRKLIDYGADIEAKSTKEGYTALMIAALMGQIFCIEALIESGAKINAQDKEGYTALMRAVITNKPDAVKKLLDLGADQDLRNKMGHTALSLAKGYKYNECKELLTVSGKTPTEIIEYDFLSRLKKQITQEDFKSLKKFTPLMIAIKCGKYDDVERFIQVYKNGEVAADKLNDKKEGLTALMLTALAGNLRILRIIKESGADIDAQDDLQGDTALIHAVKKGNFVVAERLIQLGANKSILNNNGDSALSLARESKNKKLIELLENEAHEFTYATDLEWVEHQYLEHINNKYHDKANQVIQNFTPLMIATISGEVNFVRELIKSGADKDAKTSKGYTALMHAAKRGNLKILSILIKEGTDIDAQTAEGFTALMFAAQDGNADVVKMLISEGAEINAKDTRGWTALIIAAEKGHLDVVKKLIDLGADKEAKNLKGSKALTLAAQSGHLDVVEKLIDLGAEIDAKDTQGATALMLAARKGHFAVVEKLIDLGAEINAKNTEVVTALMFAAQNGHLDVVEKLIDLGAEINAKDVQGSALMLAAQEGHFAVVEKLIDLGAEINAKNTEGFTALMIAAANEHLEVVRMLLKAGANPPSLNNIDENALMLVLNLGSMDLIQTAIISWKKAIGEALSPDEIEFLTGANYNREFAMDCLKGRSKQVAWKLATKKALSKGEKKFLSSENYDNAMAKESLEARADRVIKKLKANIKLTENETAFSNNRSVFEKLDRFKKLEKLLLKNADFIGTELLPLNQDVMHRSLGFLSMEEQFKQQAPLLLLAKMKQISKAKAKQAIKPSIVKGCTTTDGSDQMDIEGGDVGSRKLGLDSGQNELNSSKRQKVKALKDGEGNLHEVTEDSPSNWEVVDAVIIDRSLKEVPYAPEAEPVTKVFRMEVAKYDNPILNHPEASKILKASAKYKSASKLLDLGTDKEVAKTILEAVEVQGADKVMEIIFGTNQPNADDLFKAIDRNDIAEVVKLISKNPALLKATNADGNSALFMAYVYGNSNIANYLAENGAVAHEHVQETNNIMEMLDFVPQIHPDDFDAVKAMNRIEAGLEDSFSGLNLAGLLTMLMFYHHS